MRKRRLRDEFELRGEFWRPEDPDDRVRGILRYEAGRTELALLGIFGGFGGGGNDDEAKVIVGSTDAGACTLSRPIRVHLSTLLGGNSVAEQSTWMSPLLFVGAGLDEPDGARFDSMAFGFEELEAWLADSPFEQKDERGESARVTTARYEFPRSESIELPEQGARLSLEFTFSRQGDLFRSMTWTQDAAFGLAVDAPQSVDWFLEQLTHVRATAGGGRHASFDQRQACRARVF